MYICKHQLLKISLKAFIFASIVKVTCLSESSYVGVLVVFIVIRVIVVEIPIFCITKRVCNTILYTLSRPLKV